MAATERQFLITGSDPRRGELAGLGVDVARRLLYSLQLEQHGDHMTSVGSEGEGPFFDGGVVQIPNRDLYTE